MINYNQFNVIDLLQQGNIGWGLFHDSTDTRYVLFEKRERCVVLKNTKTQKFEKYFTAQYMWFTLICEPMPTLISWADLQNKPRKKTPQQEHNERIIRKLNLRGKKK